MIKHNNKVIKVYIFQFSSIILIPIRGNNDTIFQLRFLQGACLLKITDSVQDKWYKVYFGTVKFKTLQSFPNKKEIK